jgi:hypothetical protein
VRGHSDWILALVDEAHKFAASDQPRQAASTMKHLAGSYLRARVSLEVDQMACEVTATGYLPLVYARTPEGKVPLQGHAACCRRTHS